MINTEILSPNYDNFSKYDGIKFIVSARNKPTENPAIPFLKSEYDFLRFDQIESVYGFTEEWVPMYGGRSFKPQFCLSESNLQELYDHSIGFRIPLTNLLTTVADYKECLHFLDKHHKVGNSVIVSSKKVGQWIHDDFPQYKIECSTIRNYTPPQIDKVLDQGLFDSIVLSARFNPRDDIATIRQKDKVIVFANSKCGWTCMTPTCYMQVSQHNKKIPETHVCSQGGKMEKVQFNIDRLVEMGFTQFKLTPVTTEPVGKSLTLL